MSTNESSIKLKSLRDQLLKQYVTYDASNRMEYVYEAPVDTAHGAPCIITRYAYDGVSSRVTKRKEYTGTWDSTYDI